MSTIELNRLSLKELDNNELVDIEGGIPPLIIVGAIYLGSAAAGGAAGYGLYKAIKWVAS